MRLPWLLLCLLLLLDAAHAQRTRVHPYIQNLSTESVHVYVVSESLEALVLTVAGRRFHSRHAEASALAYNPIELAEFPELAKVRLPRLHCFEVSGLSPGQTYTYSVELPEGPFQASFTTRALAPKQVRFMVYADSETEPESSGPPSKWPTAAEPKRRYLVDQTTGYRANLETIRNRRPDAVLIAGDLVESGGEQRDWDEFWKHNTNADGSLSLASQFEVLPSPGNHEYYGGPKNGKYDLKASAKATSKFFTYFHSEGHNSRSHYYSKKLGPVRLIALDSCDGIPHRSKADPNFYFQAAPTQSPGINPGSRQYKWLEAELAKAQREDVFTFAFFHHCPYSGGPHGFVAGPDKSKGEDPQSGRPLRVWTPLFLKYGVDAVLNGHDEMLERSVVEGEEIRPDGSRRPHQVHFYDIGIGGDGLRTSRLSNPFRRFLAETDAPEQWVDGELVAGGRHYGHLEVNVSQDDDGWKATLDPVYLFPIREGSGWRFERRVYDDRVVLRASLGG